MGLVLHAVLCMMYFPQVWIDSQRNQGSLAVLAQRCTCASLSCPWVF
jgi:hypothetical protein